MHNGYSIIGVMTGNSMDAVDIVLTRFEGDEIQDLYSFSQNFSDDMRHKMQFLRDQVSQKDFSMNQLNALPAFHQIHDEYIQIIANSINALIQNNKLDKSKIDAIGFHGKTLDHFPPSIAQQSEQIPYTLQIGSGQLLADLTGIPVIYDFRSDDLFVNGEGAPLAPPHNEHIAKHYGLTNAIFYNAGNTSNLTVICDGMAIQGYDAGPFNEFSDRLMRQYKKGVFDKDGNLGKTGKLLPDLLKKLFYQSALIPDGRLFFEINPPKSGDPTLYHYEDIEEFHNTTCFKDVLHTAEYFAGYIAAYALKFVQPDIQMPSDFVLFGGGWKNQVAIQAFQDLLTGKGFILPEHQCIFKELNNRFIQKPTFRKSDMDQYMEARVFADLARFYLMQRTWSTPELTGCLKPVVLGIIRHPNQGSVNDKINRAAKGWEERKKKND